MGTSTRVGVVMGARAPDAVDKFRLAGALFISHPENSFGQDFCAHFNELIRLAANLIRKHRWIEFLGIR